MKHNAEYNKETYKKYIELLKLGKPISYREWKNIQPILDNAVFISNKLIHIKHKRKV